ncbi:MAG: hypothetical protein LBF93_12070 [Zoogloeaceae bacterium]|nr:hypothetical protein [Zoogloeaceae bacterium]
MNSEGGRIWRIHESVSDTPRAPGALYAQNDRFLDVRTPFDEKRGYATIGVLMFSWLAYSFGFWIVGTIIFLIEREGSAGRYISGAIMILSCLFMLVILSPVLYFIFRIETFVQRRLIVRFDRINRKVYLHRPRYAGGVVALDWEKVIVDEHEDGADQIGLPLFLTWYPKDTPHKRGEGLLLGRNAHDVSDNRHFWEFIRRFMEDGPQSVPRQKLIGKIPWPWRPLLSVLGTQRAVFESRHWGMAFAVVLMLPAFALYAVFQWISLLLCWEPVFPRKIRKACGESFLAVLQARGIDLIAWSMLGGVIYWLDATFPTLFTFTL